MTIALPSLTVNEVPIDRLHPDPANPRRISDDGLKALTRSLREFGSSSPSWHDTNERIVSGSPPTDFGEQPTLV